MLAKKGTIKYFVQMENRGFKIAFRIFYFIHLPNKEDYERKESSST